MSAEQTGTLYYLIPDAHQKDFRLRELWRAAKRGRPIEHIRQNWFRKHKPIGGVKVAYQHVEMARELGYHAEMIRLGSYEGNFFGFNVKPLHIRDVGYTLRPEDTVICPEFIPYEGLRYVNCKKVLFVQNWRWIYTHFRPEDEGKSYCDLGYDALLSCSDYITELLNREPDGRVFQVPNFIDLNKFVTAPKARETGVVMALPRKNPDDLKAIIKACDTLQVQFNLVDGVSEAEIIEQYQRSDVFLATGYPEGFALPPLEAMACGCAVVGFTGGAAREFMIDGETALVAADGDTSAATTALQRVMRDDALKARLREAGHTKAQGYTRDRSLAAQRQFLDRISVL